MNWGGLISIVSRLPWGNGDWLAETNHVDEAHAVEPDSDAADDARSIIPILDGLKCGVVDDFEVFGFETKSVGERVDLVEGGEVAEGPFDNVLNVLIFRHFNSLLESVVDGGGNGTCLWGEAHVAAAEC